ESHERYQDLFDAAPVAYILLNKRGLIADLNLAAQTLLGVGRRAMTGISFHVFLASRKDIESFLAHLRHCRAGKEKVVTELGLKGAPGVRHVELISRPQMNDDLRFFTTIIDLTQVREVQEALRTSEQALRQANQD